VPASAQELDFPFSDKINGGHNCFNAHRPIALIGQRDLHPRRRANHTGNNLARAGLVRRMHPHQNNKTKENSFMAGTWKKPRPRERGQVAPWACRNASIGKPTETNTTIGCTARGEPARKSPARGTGLVVDHDCHNGACRPSGSTTRHLTPSRAIGLQPQASELPAH
jgi:hypothetical protein